MTTWREWATGLVAGVADAVRARRTELGLTGAELSDRTASGKPLTRAVISDLETGRKRTLEVAELLTLAAALEVSPLSLLLPDVRNDVEILPGVKVPGIDALGWFTGNGAPGATNPAAAAFSGDEGMGVALALVRVELTLRTQRHNLTMAEKAPELFDMSDQMKAMEAAQADHARDQIKALEAERDRLTWIYGGIVERRNG